MRHQRGSITNMFNKDDKPLLMAILNVTPDSFSDGGQYIAVDAAVRRAGKILTEGADIIDIGGESTRPGSEAVSATEQIGRVVPIIEALRSELPQYVPISIDTTLSAVAEAALAAGASLINDISAGRDDDRMLPLAAQRDVPIILMHMQGTPKTMQDDPHYGEVVDEVLVPAEKDWRRRKCRSAQGKYPHRSGHRLRQAQAGQHQPAGQSAAFRRVRLSGAARNQ